MLRLRRARQRQAKQRRLLNLELPRVFLASLDLTAATATMNICSRKEHLLVIDCGDLGLDCSQGPPRFYPEGLARMPE
jgi:hypothetical protein